MREQLDDLEVKGPPSHVAQIPFREHTSHTFAQAGEWLEEIGVFLSEHDDVFDCSGERCYTESDTNAAIHHEDCPSMCEDHFSIVLEEHLKVVEGAINANT